MSNTNLWNNQITIDVIENIRFYQSNEILEMHAFEIRPVWVGKRSNMIQSTNFTEKGVQNKSKWYKPKLDSVHFGVSLFFICSFNATFQQTGNVWVGT